MRLSLKIAWRNLFRHKGKSMIIGAILMLGAFLMTVGSGVISGMDRGLSENIVNLFTGDIVIASDKQEDENVLFDMEGKPLETITDYKKVKAVLDKNSNVEKHLPVNAGYVIIFNEDGNIGDGLLLGVDIERYKKMFPNNYSVIEGRDMKPNERGMLFSSVARENIYNFMDFWVVPKGSGVKKENLTKDAIENIANLKTRDEIVYMGISDKNSTVDVRAEVKGIFKYRALSKIWENYSIIDSESFRECFNYVSGEDSANIGETEKKLMDDSVNLDDMFGSSSIVTESSGSAKEYSIEDIQAETKKSEKKIDLDAGAYNLAFVKVKDGIKVEDAIKNIEKEMKDNGCKVKVIPWKKAVGPIGGMTTIIRGALILFTLLIFFVAIIVIMNTLTMAAIERSGEIAMMRAIGARKGFISEMFLAETGMLSFVFGGAGIVIGVLFIMIINSMGITTTNDFLQILYGGDRFMPIVTIGDIIGGVIELGIVTFIAALYPILVVRKIVPLDAIARD
jgi:ABC-type lipoprotein release transport system permease subunit